MAAEMPGNIIGDAMETKLNEEIQALRDQVQELKSHRSIQVSNILTSRATESLLTRLRDSNPTTPSVPSSSSPQNDTNPLHQAIVERSQKQQARNQECLYRTCAGITTFRVRDPDPFAVDRGKVFGIRIEAFANAKFLRPYYIFLNKPYRGSQLFRVHRHTVPPCVPLAALAAKYLPTPSAGSDLLKARKQDFPRFVRCLRRELVNYHNRVAAIAGLKTAFGLDENEEGRLGKGRTRIVENISAADAEAKQIRIEWADGRVGRIVVDSRGQIQKCVITGESGRDRRLERSILDAGKRIDNLIEVLGQST